MLTRRTIIYGGLLGVPLLALGASGLVAAGQGTASAAPPATSITATKADEKQLVAAAVARFAARLGKDEATVNAAFVGAVTETIDQAVRDGALTQAQATAIKDETAKLGLTGVLLQGAGSARATAPDPLDDIARAMFEAAATTLGLTPAQLKSEGKSIKEVARARSIDLQRVKDAMLAAGKATLEAAVQGGGVSQAQARNLEADLPKLMTKLVGAGRGAAEPGQSVEQAIWQAAAKTLEAHGLDLAQVKQAMAGGKSITDIAQEKGIALQPVKEAMLSAGKAQLTMLVQQGKLSQAQADERQRGLPAEIDKLLALRPGTEAGEKKP